MAEYTSLDMSRKLQEAGFTEKDDGRYRGDPKYGVDFENREAINGTHHLDMETETDFRYSAYRTDTLLEWLLSHGDSIEITPDLDGFNCTFWKGHDDYNGTSIFLPDALGSLVLKVMGAEHGDPR